ncbi:MAG: tetratricopeptide repeat protein [Nitrospira sp.]|nr:tetratricopeptide repeat protein [Nitrospira sp.]
MSASTAPPTYSLRSVRDLLGLPARTVSRLIEGGFVKPGRGPRNEFRFSFQDVVLLRTAEQLLAAGITPRKVLKSLARLRHELPADLPLSGLRISAIGADVAVRSGGLQWDAESQQLLMDFELAPAGGAVAVITHAGVRAMGVDAADAKVEVAAEAAAISTPPPAASALAHAAAIEHSDPAAAEAAYRATIARVPESIDARLNLGALLFERGRLGDALAVYDDALARAPREARLHYNRALVLEDLQRSDDAIAAYDTCLAIAPDFADAHFNAARLHELRGRTQAALRHFSAYRRLQR